MDRSRLLFFVLERVCVCVSISYADGFRKTIVCAIQRKAFHLSDFVLFFLSIGRFVGGEGSPLVVFGHKRGGGSLCVCVYVHRGPFFFFGI